MDCAASASTIAGRRDADSYMRIAVSDTGIALNVRSPAPRGARHRRGAQWLGRLVPQRRLGDIAFGNLVGRPPVRQQQQQGWRRQCDAPRK
jgi:hypothetical protein